LGAGFGARGEIARFRSSPKAFRVIPFVRGFAPGSGFGDGGFFVSSGSSGAWDFMHLPYHVTA